MRWFWGNYYYLLLLVVLDIYFNATKIFTFMYLCIYFRSSITRDKFEELCEDLWDRSLTPLKEVLNHSGLKVDEIYAVELIGGATRVPKLQVGTTFICLKNMPGRNIAHAFHYITSITNFLHALFCFIFFFSRCIIVSFLIDFSII